MFSTITKVLPSRALVSMFKLQNVSYAKKVAVALRSTKGKSERCTPKSFIDTKVTRTIGGKGGDGSISFLRLWCNENAGPDGGDGGNGGHVVLQATNDIRDLKQVTAILKGEPGEKGYPRDCHGKNANHTLIKVPIGTIVKNQKGEIVGDLDKDGVLFVAARGGAGGKGNHFFVTSTDQAPKIAEYGANGEDLSYQLELRSMAHFGLIGLPNAGKSTLLRAISRARPKVASYPFTTLQPHLGMVEYDDYEQIAVADLPGLIPDSHLNRGLGIQFLKHAERCSHLLFIVDVSCDEPWTHYFQLIKELEMFSHELADRPKILVANKIDLPDAEENLRVLKEKVDVPVIGISAKMGTNVAILLAEIRVAYDRLMIDKEENLESNQ